MIQKDELITFLSDEKIKEVYFISDEMIKSIEMNPYHSNDMVALLQFFVSVVNDSMKTPYVSASQINNFLDSRL